MRTEVKTLIAALTTERNSIDRAIAALKNMSDGAEPTPAVKRTREPKRRVFLPDEAKAAIAQQMADAQPGTLAVVAKRMSREYGAPYNTIYTRWQMWGKNGHTVATVTNPNMTTAPADLEYAGV